MRPPLAALVALAIASPAAAQSLPAPPPLLGSRQILSPQDFEIRQQLEATRQQLIQQQNQMMSLDAQLRAEQGIAHVQAQAREPQIPLPDVTPGRPLPQIDTSQLATIPDSALAESNRKVLEAAGNHR